MTQPQLNRRLSSLDASFLYYEKKEAPLHVGSTMVFDGEIPFEEFKRMLSAKLPLLPRYRQKVVPAPFNVGHPTWEFDPNFDISNHIFHLQLEAPGTMEELRALSNRVMSKMLDRNKPLWEMYVIDGLEGQRSALISKVHHAMVDGVAGTELMNISFDLSPNPAPLPKLEASTPEPTRPYSITQNYIEGLLDSAEEAMKSWTTFRRGLIDFSENLLKDSNRAFIRPASNSLAALAAPVSPMPFNKPVSGQRELSWSIFSFQEARAIRAALGGTINDVVLTVVSRAISRYLELHEQKTAGCYLRMMVPVSVRPEGEKGALGNMVSVLPVEVPMDIKNLKELYAYVTKKTTQLKRTRIAEGFNLFSGLLGTVPASLQAFIGTIANTSVPIFNIVCTNVPGPQMPLYVLGKKMTHSYPYVPIAYTVGLTVAIFSYDQKLFFSLTGDAKTLADLEETFKPLLEQSFMELKEVAGVTPPEPVVEEAKISSVADNASLKSSTAVKASSLTLRKNGTARTLATK